MNKKSIKKAVYSDLILYILLFLLICLPLIYSFSIEKHLSADGVHYLTVILDRKNFAYASWSRQFANYLTQWPLVLAVKIGLTNIPLLTQFYAIGLYLIYIISYSFCIYAVRRENRFLLVFPLISIIGINLSADYILIGEHHVMVLLSWPIFLLLLRRNPLNWSDGWVLWILLTFFSLTYETSIIPAVIFSVISAKKLHKVHQNRKEIIIYSISLFLSLLTLLISFYFIINPKSPVNQFDFGLAILNFTQYKVALISASFAFLLTIGLTRRKNYFILVSLFPMTLYICLVIFSTQGPTAIESFNSRTLSLTLLPFLFICTLISWYYNIKLNKISTKILILFVLIMIIGNLRFANDWKNFRQQFIDIITTKNGYISIDETIIKDSMYSWPWTHSHLSIVWSYPCVKTILLNRSDTKWQPFDPQEKLILKNYISYDVFFSSVDNNIMICK